MKFREPDPIVIDGAMLERARGLLEAIAQGTFDRSELLPELDDFVRPEAFVNGAALVSALGTPEAMFAFEKRITADQTSTYFRVRYHKEALTWVVSVDAANRITGLSLRRGPNDTIFGIVWRDVRY